jgi:uncharacterized protein
MKTAFTSLKRARERGSHSKQDLYNILDATPMCHFGYTVDHRPVVTPTCHWRDGDYVYWHGSRLSRALLASINQEVCLTVSLLDGLVLARSGFHHSANYRSAMVFGKAELIADREAKIASLKTFVDGLFPGRWDTLRPATNKEINATTVLRLPLDEASAKVRIGPPNDLPEDVDFPVWAGVLPISMVTGVPEPAPDLNPNIALPKNIVS